MALNVLLADDSATMRAMVGRVIQMCGVPINRLYEAANGREGLDVLEKEWIDVVIVDINMPVMGGMEMIDEIRKKPDFAKLPVIVVSTESSQTRIDEIQSKGIEFIHKPFTPEQVRKVLVKVMGDMKDASE
jgi:two-component system chemotaxis response regulator CheY